MQCANCRFENMPGVPACGRCGTSLKLAMAVLDVHPPRAKNWQKQLRRLLTWQTPAARIRDAAQASGQFGARVAEFYSVPLPPVRRLLWAVIPGLGHFQSGQRVRGRLFLAAYLCLVIPGVLYLGTNIGSVLLGLAFSVHLCSVMDLIWQQPVEFPSRWLVAFAALATLTLAYAPATWLVGGLVTPRVIAQTATPFEAGDCLLTNRWSYVWSRPKPGDVVLYRFGGATLGRYIVESGEVVDRVLAGPGDHLKWSDHSLFVNGEESRLRPLDPHWPGELKECAVPQNYYLVLPSSVPYPNDRVRCAVYRTANLVPEEDILGTAYVRHQPLTRFWWIR